MGVIVENPSRIREADIIVGIPSYNEADSIAYPTKIASEGLVEYFSEKKSVIINATLPGENIKKACNVNGLFESLGYFQN